MAMKNHTKLAAAALLIAVASFMVGRITAQSGPSNAVTKRADPASPNASGRDTEGAKRRLTIPKKTAVTQRDPENARPGSAGDDPDALRSKIAELEEELTFHRGRPYPFPATLEARFEREELTRRINKALKDAATGAEISLVECDEYPCVACGQMPEQTGAEPDINGDLERLKRASKSPTMEPYKDDGKSATVTTASTPDSGGQPRHQTLFCQSFFQKPESPEHEAELKKRIDVRMQEIMRGLR
jgi:hypothetical protein